MSTQEEVRKLKETKKKEELDALKGKENLAEGASAARTHVAKEMKKSHDLAARMSREDASGPVKKRKPDQSKTTPPPGTKPKRKKTAPPKAKPQKKDKPPQGERKVPVPGDTHGCNHTGLLDLLPLERKYLQAYVKVGGWLHETPCHDCEKNEGGSDKRVLDVSDLLSVKGRGGLGVYCNCGPVGHNMLQEEEPVRKQQWACNMVLCMDCFSRRKTGMGGSGGGGRRTRRPQKLD
jgi:hypothetical protein